MIASINLVNMESLCFQETLFWDAQRQSQKHLSVSADSFFFKPEECSLNEHLWGTREPQDPALPVSRRLWVSGGSEDSRC